MTAPDGSVLVVDDQPSKRYILATWLRRGGYDVVEAATGAEALARVREGGIGAVVLDVKLPDLSGFEVSEQIKGDPRHEATPIIHVSAAAIDPVDRTQGLARGADAYLAEPIDPDELLATIGSVLRYYRARRHAEALAARLATLARVNTAISTTTSFSEMLEIAVQGATSIFDAPAAVVATRTDGAQVAATSAGPGAPVTIQPWPLGRDEPPVGTRYSDESAHRCPPNAWPAGETVRVLTVRGRLDRPPVRVLVPTRADVEGAPVLTLLGQAVVSAVNLIWLFDEERDLALTLQRSLLPRRLPQLPELELAVRYVPATKRAEIGGDFYEAVLIGTTLHVAVGDVGGHSLHAATIMAELRHATRAYLSEGHGPARVINELNRLMARLIPDEIATMCLLAIDRTSGEVRLANAGHPPPLVATAEGVAVVDRHTALLGIEARPAEEVRFALDPGDTLIVYTDGLVERRGELPDVGVARLAAAAREVEPNLEAFASRILHDVGPADARDDIAFVAIRRARR